MALLKAIGTGAHAMKGKIINLTIPARPASCGAAD